MREVGSGHFAERFQLFIIIALGESIVITGSTTASHELTTATVVAFGLAFLITAALWWLYFNLVAAIAERRLAQAVNRTVLARDAYTYLHVVIVAGILLTAVGDEIVIAHPTDELKDAELAAVVSGPALYLLALVLLRVRMVGSIAGRRLAGAPRVPGGGRGRDVCAGAGGRGAAVRGAGCGDRGDQLAAPAGGSAASPRCSSRRRRRLTRPPQAASEYAGSPVFSSVGRDSSSCSAPRAGSRLSTVSATTIAATTSPAPIRNARW